MSSLAENLEKVTVRIECEDSVGTGFIYSVMSLSEETKVPLLITNKHVVKNQNIMKIHMQAVDINSGAIYPHFTFDIHDLQNLIIPHPDENVDLCAIVLTVYFQAMLINQKKPDYFSFSRKELFENSPFKTSLKPMEEVYMTGYPNGIWDDINNKPITRRGLTASNIHSDWKGKKEFIIDMACFPGSSGSPVYIYNEGTFFDGNSIVSGARLVLLGVLYAGPQIATTGRISIIDIPTNSQYISTTPLMINLGIIIKAEKIMYFEDHFSEELNN